MSDYAKTDSDLYGSIMDAKGRRTVPFLQYVSRDGRHCRIALEEYDRWMRHGLSKVQILERHAEWYGDATQEYKRAYYKAIADRDAEERKAIREMGLSDKEYIQACIDKIRKNVREVRKKSVQVVDV